MLINTHDNNINIFWERTISGICVKLVILKFAWGFTNKKKPDLGRLLVGNLPQNLRGEEEDDSQYIYIFICDDLNK